MNKIVWPTEKEIQEESWNKKYIEAHGDCYTSGFRDAEVWLKANVKIEPVESVSDRDLVEQLGLLAGAASCCWEPRPNGVFDSTLASKFVDEAFVAIRACEKKMREK